MPLEKPNLELGELLDCLASSGQHTQNVEADLQTERLALVYSQLSRKVGKKETYSLAEGSALANGNLVTLLNTESGRDVGGKVLVSLLVTRVLGDKVEVLSSDNDGSVHLGGNDGAGQDTATDGDGAGEGALLVYIAQSQQFPVRQRLSQFVVFPSRFRRVVRVQRSKSFAIAFSMRFSICQPFGSTQFYQSFASHVPM